MAKLITLENLRQFKEKLSQSGGNSNIQDIIIDNTSAIDHGIVSFTTETWTAVLSNGSTVHKKIVCYDN